MSRPLVTRLTSRDQGLLPCLHISPVDPANNTVTGDGEVLHAVDLQPPHLRIGGEEQQWLPHGGDTKAVLHGVALHAGAGEAAHRVLADLAARPKYLTLINIQAATLVCSYLVPRLTVAGGAGGGVDAPVGASGGGPGGSK